MKIQHEQEDGNLTRGRLRVPTGLRRRARVVVRDTSVRVSNQYGWRDAEDARVRVAQIQDSNAGGISISRVADSGY
jgi:hypothetical protein